MLYDRKFMACAILTIGTEITRGELTDTNGAWLSTRLTELGHEVLAHETCDDDLERIVERLNSLANRFAVVFVTGGLGPTSDDLTSLACAMALKVRLVRDAGSIDAMKARFEKLGRPMNASNEKQADFPEGASVLANPIGTAPGFSVKMRKCELFFMPGVPREMMRMFDTHVVPAVAARASNNQVQVRLRTYGMPESQVGDKLRDIEQKYAATTLGDGRAIVIGYRAHSPEIEVKVRAVAKTCEDAEALCLRVVPEVRERLGDIVYAEGETPFPSFVAAELGRKKKTLAIAESCTGGLVGHLLTVDAGASAFLLFDGVVYDNRAKSKVLGIDEREIGEHGAVSELVCSRMAEKVRALMGADIGLSITGIAGPGGGTTEKPVGTVFLGVSTRHGVEVVKRKFGTERVQIQRSAAFAALDMVRRVIDRC